jgi:hypothetical protein
MSDHTALWDRVKVTDPRAVKAITGKPYKGNSPKPYWLIERATQEFGPVGIGWGVTVKSERFERLTESDVLHVAVVSVWYMLDGKRSETFDQMGGTKAAYQSKNGMIVDEDAGKKSVTDGMVKCLSMIGFAGDIFSGMWDDSKYVEQAGQFYEAKARAEDPERCEWLTAQREAIMHAANVGELRRILSEAIATAQSENDSAAVDQLNAWADEKRAQAKPKAA